AAGPDGHHIALGSFFGPEAQARTGITTRMVFAQIMLLNESRRGARDIAGNLEILGSHHHGVNWIVDPKRNRLADEIVETENRHGLVRWSIFVVSEPPSATRREFAAIDVGVRRPHSNSEAGRLQLQLGAADRRYGGILDAFRIGCRYQVFIELRALRCDALCRATRQPIPPKKYQT